MAGMWQTVESVFQAPNQLAFGVAGSLPEAWGGLQNLTYLNLGTNYLTGGDARCSASNGI